MKVLQADSFSELMRDARAALAVRLAMEAGGVLLPVFRAGVRAHNKLAARDAGGSAGFDPVTQADRAAEEHMRGLIAQAFPDDGIIGEEMGVQQANAPWQWVLDPIDGTRAFVCGLPGFTVLVALLHEGRPVLGVVHAPAMRWLVIGNNVACWQMWDDGVAQPVRTARQDQLAQALAGTTLPRLYDTPGKRALLEALQRRARHVQFDGDALFYAAVAAGRMHVALDTGLQRHDAAALVPVVRGAGGVISDWRGNADVVQGDVLACANEALHAQMLALMAETGAV